MFKKLLAKIKLIRAEKKYQRGIDLRAKYFYIRNALIKWYMDYDRIYDVCDIPAYIRADRVMRKTLKVPADIDRSYKKLIEYQKAIGV